MIARDTDAGVAEPAENEEPVQPKSEADLIGNFSYDAPSFSKTSRNDTNSVPNSHVLLEIHLLLQCGLVKKKKIGKPTFNDAEAVPAPASIPHATAPLPPQETKRTTAIFDDLLGGSDEADELSITLPELALSAPPV